MAAAQQVALAAFAASNRASPSSSVASMAQFFPGAMAAASAAAGHTSLSGMQSAAVANTLAQQFGQFPPSMASQLAQLPQVRAIPNSN